MYIPQVFGDSIGARTRLKERRGTGEEPSRQVGRVKVKKTREGRGEHVPL